MHRAYAYKFLATLSLLLCASGAASAATLQAKVVEVRTGNSIVVSNINRAVLVRLKAVAPPEAGQPFSEVARDHLKALVLDKTVTVEYTHFADNYLEARVLLNGVDIGSQMLRDGAAWYDHALEYELNQPDRDLYAQCEAAARAEKRGLWQDPSPMAPWEYRRIQNEKRVTIERPPASLVSSAQLRQRSPGLSNKDVMKLVMSSSSPTFGLPDVQPIAKNGDGDRWVKYNSAAGHFSVTLPSNAVEGTQNDADPSGKNIPFHFVTGGSERGFYMAMSATGPNGAYSDDSSRDEAIQGLIRGMNDAAAQHGHPNINLKAPRPITLNGYSGMQYELSGGDISGTARVYTRQVGAQREMFILFAVNTPGNESLGAQFLKSFVIQR